MKKKYFITGTDTDVGKTVVACALLEAFNRQGLSTLALKPIAAGCETTPLGLRNDDALKLMDAMSMDLPYDQVNPVKVAPAIAPHIALKQENRRVTLSQLEGYCRGVLMRPGDVVVVEGAGGWRVPLNDREFISDLPVSLQIPVILVVGVRLGCLNHALLTMEAIQQDGLPLAGWIANRIDPDTAQADENINYLRCNIPAPCLADIPYLPSPDVNDVLPYIKIDPLLD